MFHFAYVLKGVFKQIKTNEFETTRRNFPKGNKTIWLCFPKADVLFVFLSPNKNSYKMIIKTFR